MTESFEVQNAMKTGKSSPQFGEEYYVKFVESEQTFPLWFKKDPTGTKIDGEINGSKFSKAKKEYKPNAETNVTKKEWTPMKRDNSDGQRQGMCLNNAANYVTACATEIVTPKVWAKAVYEYGNALYLLGELGQEPPAEVETPAPKSVKDIA